MQVDADTAVNIIGRTMTENNLTGAIPLAWTSNNTFPALTLLDLRNNSFAGKTFPRHWLKNGLMKRHMCGVSELYRVSIGGWRRDTPCTSGYEHTFRAKAQR